MPTSELPVCPCCMEQHEPSTVRRREANIWKGLAVHYDAEYFWCRPADTYFADERMIRRNHRAMIRAVLEMNIKEAAASSAVLTKEELEMSYDISLRDPVTRMTLTVEEPHFMTGGTYQIGGCRELWLNITYNYGQLYRRDDVFGSEGIRTIYGMTGADSIPVLEKAAAALGDEASDDYWEATEGNAKKPLLQLIAMAKMRPDGIWEGD